MLRVRLVALALLAAAGVCSSCGGPPARLTVYPVKGQMTFNGKPAAGAMVVFHPRGGEAAERQLRPVAAVQTDGSFTPHTYDYQDGLPAGEYAVTVHWYKPQGKAGEAEGDGGGMVSRLPGKYEKPETSGLRIAVEKGPNQTKADGPGPLTRIAPSLHPGYRTEGPP